MKSFNAKEKFDFFYPPINPRWYLMPIEWIGAQLLGGPALADIEKINCEDLKPPYLMLSTHACMRDFAMAVRAMFPYRSYWIISVEEFAGREWLFRSIGGIAKRKFTQQVSVVKHSMNVMKKRGQICTIYPEARYSLAGINERLDGALGKLAKQCGVPVVVFIQHGNFLSCPQWNKTPERKVKSKGEYIQVVTREEVAKLSATEIQKRIEDAFVYDDYAWQWENKVKIDSPYRAHNIHRILYQCPICKKEFSMNSDHTELWCEDCGAKWEMDEFGRLHRVNDGDVCFEHVPDWYNWERENVREQVNSGAYSFEDEARIELLASSREQFRPIGTVTMRHDLNGFTLTGTLDDGSEFHFNRAPETMISCHIEYDFKGRGDAVDLATREDTYWLFPKNARNVLTKLHFATEALYDRAMQKTSDPE